MENTFDRRDRTVYVWMMHHSVTDDVLYDIFSKIGPIEKVIFKANIDGSPQHALVVYRNVDSVRRAIQEVQGVYVSGHPINVRPLRENSLPYDHPMYPGANRHGSLGRSPDSGDETSPLTDSPSQWPAAYLQWQKISSSQDGQMTPPESVYHPPHSPLPPALHHKKLAHQNPWGGMDLLDGPLSPMISSGREREQFAGPRSHFDFGPLHTPPPMSTPAFPWFNANRTASDFVPLTPPALGGDTQFFACDQQARPHGSRPLFNWDYAGFGSGRF